MHNYKYFNINITTLMSVDGMLVIHLPDGPTAHFRLSNVKLTPELKVCRHSYCYMVFYVHLDCRLTFGMQGFKPAFPFICL
jgi:hypothetical protein